MPKAKKMGMGQSSRAKQANQPYPANPSQQNQHCYCPPPEPPKPDPMQLVEGMRSELDSLEKEVNAFVGSSSDKQYRYLDEMLTRSMIKLDNIDTEGQSEVRAARKDVLNNVHRLVSLLESRCGKSPSHTESTDLVPYVNQVVGNPPCNQQSMQSCGTTDSRPDLSLTQFANELGTQHEPNTNAIETNAA